MPAYDHTYNTVVSALNTVLKALSESVPPPVVVKTAGGHAYRYKEQLVQQALVLKCARALSALISIKTLLDAGLTLDAGAIMRVNDEVGSDIMFLSGPLIFGHAPETRHNKYLVEFFQEEFDNVRPIRSTRKRNRVGRKDIRAYVARTFAGNANVSDLVAATETMENISSGYVHGAGVHILDVYDGRSFSVAHEEGSKPLDGMKQQFTHHIHCTLMSFGCAAKAMGHDRLFNQIHGLTRNLFDEYGELRSQRI